MNRTGTVSEIIFRNVLFHCILMASSVECRRVITVGKHDGGGNKDGGLTKPQSDGQRGTKHGGGGEKTGDGKDVDGNGK